MSEEKSGSSASGGIGFFGVLAIVFIVLKLTETSAVAEWSWWLVLAPLWGPFLFWVAILAIAVVGAFLLAGFKR